jgi:hypothetical protein
MAGRKDGINDVGEKLSSRVREWKIQLRVHEIIETGVEIVAERWSGFILLAT